MNNWYECGLRLTHNNLQKITNIYFADVETCKGFKFYSSYDECAYIYPHYNLEEAINAYERDTKWQGYSQIRYYTNVHEIKLMFDKIRPF